MISITFYNPYIWIMVAGALILLLTQIIIRDQVLLYGVLVGVGLLMIIIPAMIQVIEVIRFLI